MAYNDLNVCRFCGKSFKGGPGWFANLCPLCYLSSRY